MSRTRMSILIAAAAVAAGLVLAVGTVGEDGSDKAGGSGGTHELRVGTADTSGRPSGAAIEEFARQADAVSGGRIQIKPVFEAAGPDEVPEWDQHIVRMVQSGELEMAVIPARSWDTEGVTSLQALHAPFLVTSQPLVERIVTGPLAAELLGGLDRAGVVGLALLPEDLRHPFGFAHPLRAPADFAGKTVRVPWSKLSYALYQRLGATPDDASGGEFKQGVDDGRIVGADSGFAIANSTLQRRATATANISFYPKVNSLVIRAAAWTALTAEQRDQLREAARRTLASTVENAPLEDDAARRYCASGGRVVLAHRADHDALVKATRPLYAELERDAETKELIERIRALKRDAPAERTVPTACEPPARPAQETVAADPHVLDGVWRMEVTYREGVEAGLPAGVAAEEMGLQTIRMEAGRFDWRWRARTGEDRCPGTYEIVGEIVRFTEGADCGGAWEAAFALDGPTIRWSRIRSHSEGDRVDQLVRELLHARSWRRIEEISSPTVEFPAGVYRAEIPAAFLVARGVDAGTAATNSGLMTMTFKSGRWLHQTKSPTNEPDCGGSYSVSRDRVSVRLDPGPECGGTAGKELFSASWTLRDGELRFRAVRSGDGDDVFARAAWGAKPWRKIR